MTLSLLVVARIGASLLGCNWLEKITLNWKAIHAVNNNEFQEPLNQYLDVFNPGVGSTKLTSL